ncbi:HD family phosphohydrolase [Candidatus Poribacteria bacterium]|nr:HD family phosphohydrolase [Candidatus Poribacteria bacterium]
MNIRIDQTLAEQMTGITAAEKVVTLFDYMERRGQSFYDESVTQLQHACQCANQARLHDGSGTQVASALLHDIGHFLLDEHNAESDFLEEDQNHEEVGADYLEPFFPEAVITPIRLHVPAKRYLCTTDASYYDGLSEASKRSFRVQGGGMSDKERTAFERIPHYEDALQLRRWDDLAKVRGLETPAIDTYREIVQACLK